MERTRLLNGAVMLSEAKHLWFVSVAIGGQMFRDSSQGSE